MLRLKAALALFAQILAALVLVTTPASADEPEAICDKSIEGATWCNDCIQTSPIPEYEQDQWTCTHNAKANTYYWDKTESYEGPSPTCGTFEKEYCGQSQKN
jgi:hypothetical protein